MKIIKYPERHDWHEIVERPIVATEKVFSLVLPVIQEVKEQGDKALLRLTEEVDKVKLSSIEVSESEIAQSGNDVPLQLKQAIEMARRNIWKFHLAQMPNTVEVETSPEVFCTQKSIAIEKVGLYVPGGSAPSFSAVLMLAIPAQIAECKEIILCTPPDEQGKIHPAILYAAKISGVKRVFKIGGAQAIAAMAYGTESVPKVYKIFGQGNHLINAAKQLVYLQGTAIDLPSGFSGLEVLADKTAHPEFVAADLLAQCEQCADNQVILLTTDEDIITPVLEQIEMQIEKLPQKEIARKSLENSKIIVVKTIEQAVEFTNLYAPEHLIIATQYYKGVAEGIVNAGSAYLGNYSPISAGYYVSGTNHFLPADSLSKAYSGVNIDSFFRKLTFQHLTRAGLSNIANAAMLMAETEGFAARCNAVKVRIDEEIIKPEIERR
ncbi:MAG: histidinol dehydrogenase [Paludibacter sp.]|jgi:histidinol dehydrogenase|nr:histidinol dehydrogenase [Paludibacter sp.]